MENSAFLGRGWSFPPTFQGQGQSVDMVTGAQDIAQSLRILFSTRLKERTLHHAYGTDFDSYLFEPIDGEMMADLRNMITEAIDFYEPRINLDRIDFTVTDDAETTVQMELEFTIKGTNTRHNLVYPFNLAEGSLYDLVISK